jgi:hypothetical protein
LVFIFDSLFLQILQIRRIDFYKKRRFAQSQSIVYADFADFADFGLKRVILSASLIPRPSNS